MSVTLYDEVLLQKLKYWTEKSEINVYGVDDTQRLFEVLADKNKDKPIKLPMICLRRIDGFTIDNSNKKPMSFDGLTLDASYDNSTSLNAIPIMIPYKLDVYTRYQKENDAYIRNLIFNIINYPTLQIALNYNGVSREHNATLRLSSNSVSMLGDSHKIFIDQFCRQTLSLNIDDAYLWDLRARQNVHISTEFGSYIEVQDERGFIIEYV